MCIEAEESRNGTHTPLPNWWVRVWPWKPSAQLQIDTCWVFHPPCHQTHIQYINPFTPESDQCQISPAASPEILHHTVRRTWLFIAYSGEKWLYYKFSLHHSYNRFLKGWENTLFELWRLTNWVVQHYVYILYAARTITKPKLSLAPVARMSWKITIQPQTP